MTEPIPALPGVNPVADKLNENSRTYLFPGGDTITVPQVRELLVRPSGNHRLKTADGRLHIIASGWLAISIEDDSKEWTV